MDDVELVGELLQHSTLGADMIGRRAFTGRDEIRGQYERTNIVYPGKGRATREMYTNVVIDIDLDAGTARPRPAHAHWFAALQLSLLVRLRRNVLAASPRN
ncbi:MAG: hypothetical protein ABIQ73_25795 [Acidimicrobiales bacterium]